MTISPIGPAIPEPIEIARFQAHFKQLTKDRFGDYDLRLGVGKEDKDKAWALTDYDGMMLDIVVTVIPRIRPTALPNEWETD